MVEETVVTKAAEHGLARYQGIYYILQGRAFFFWIMWNCVTASPHYSHLMVDQKNEEVSISPPEISFFFF